MVLNLLRSWSPIDSLSLKRLSLKLCMLIALLVVPRSQTLQALDLDRMVILGSNISFHVATLLKTSKQGRPIGQEIHMEAYPSNR